MKPDRNYYLFLADIIGSTILPARKMRTIMSRLERQLKKLNRILKPKPAHALTINYGDEIAGFFTSPAQLFDIVAALRDTLYPDAKLRFVVARGRIAVPSNRISKMGGEVLKRANTALQRLKKRRKFCLWLLGNPVLNAALTSLTETSNILLENMTQYQRDVFSLLDKGSPQKKIAQKLGKHAQSVSDAVQRSNAEIVLETHRTIKMLLSTDQWKIIDLKESIEND